MALDAALPPSLRALLDDLRNRLGNLERSPRLTASSLRGGLLKVLRADGSPVVTMGEDPVSGRSGLTGWRKDGTRAFAITDTGNGLRQFAGIFDRNDNVVLSDDTENGGIASPWLPIPAVPLRPIEASGYAYMQTSDPSTLNLHLLQFYQQNPALMVDGVAFSGPNTTGKIQIMDEVNSRVLWEGALAAGGTLFLPGYITPAALDTSRLFTTRRIFVRAIRTSGTSTIAVALLRATGCQTLNL